MMKPAAPATAAPTWAFRLGQVAQIVATGLLLPIAIVNLLQLAGGVVSFAYQGF